MELSKDDLIQKVRKQIQLDLDVGDYEALEELLTFTPTENLIGFLYEEDQKQFKHLK